jgi:hypothetical protein
MPTAKISLNMSILFTAESCSDSAQAKPLLKAGLCVSARTDAGSCADLVLMMSTRSAMAAKQRGIDLIGITPLVLNE